MVWAVLRREQAGDLCTVAPVVVTFSMPALFASAEEAARLLAQLAKPRLAPRDAEAVGALICVAEMSAIEAAPKPRRVVATPAVARPKRRLPEPKQDHSRKGTCKAASTRRPLSEAAVVAKAPKPIADRRRTVWQASRG